MVRPIKRERPAVDYVFRVLYSPIGESDRAQAQMDEMNVFIEEHSGARGIFTDNDCEEARHKLSDFARAQDRLVVALIETGRSKRLCNVNCVRIGRRNQTVAIPKALRADPKGVEAYVDGFVERLAGEIAHRELLAERKEERSKLKSNSGRRSKR